ncbi:MAG: hypothetical protein ACI4RG_04885 [Huintestinicola sp.]
MRRDKKENFNFLLKYLPPVFSSLAEKDIDGLCEIRLRADRAAVLIFADRTEFLTASGRLTGFYSEGLFTLSRQEIEDIFIRMCNYSVHSLTENIAEGFITLEGGCRVGVYGTAVVKDGKITSVRNIEGMNIRVPAEYRGCAQPIYNRLFYSRIPNTVICGPPMSGKTTVLRDLSRLISDEGMKKVAVIDERFELSGGDLGFNADVLKNYPKAQGIGIAVRTLSPDVIICDEIGTLEEAQALCSLFNCGVKFIVSMHCSDLTELKRRPQFALLSDAGVADACVLLNEKNFGIKKILMNRN